MVEIDKMICAMYRSGMTQATIGTKIGRTTSQVTHIIRKANRDALLAFRSRVVS